VCVILIYPLLLLPYFSSSSMLCEGWVVSLVFGLCFGVDWVHWSLHMSTS
jgi:hypothetical protein